MHSRRRTGQALTIFTSLAAVSVLMAACGGSTAGGSAGRSSPSSGPAPTALAKPSDASQTVTDAIARTASFRDVEWDDTLLTVSDGMRTEYGNAFTATKDPARIRNITKPGPGTKRLTTISDIAANVLCTEPEGSPKQKFTGQHEPAGGVDPFYDLGINGSAWRFLPDADLNGHADWQLTGKLRLGQQGGTFTPTSSDVEVFINPGSGKIDQVVAHAVLVQPGKPGTTDRTDTTKGFVYDTGATIPAC